MSRHGFNKNNDNNQHNLWKELADGIEKAGLRKGKNNDPSLAKAAEDVKKIYDAFIDAGFTSGQALQLVMVTIAGGKSK